MQKIFIAGSGPLPEEGNGVANAGGLRTSQFLQGIINEYDVSLFVFENSEYTGMKTISEKRHFRHCAVSRHDPNAYRLLKNTLQTCKPDVSIGVNTWPSGMLAKAIDAKTPFWADLNGWAVAEVQAQSFAMDSDAYLAHTIRMERDILCRADKISTVSNPQKYAVIGELAQIKRLNKDNFRHPFVEVIENTCRPLSGHEKKGRQSVFGGKTFPETAKVILWVGGFNAWADERSLFEALEFSMRNNSDIHFVCTGGELKGIDETTFFRFRDRVSASEFKDRYHFLGWIPSEQMPALFRESDIGINVDLPCIETETGARNRINEMLRFELPVITTRGAEISHVLEKADAALVASQKSPKEIAEKILAFCTEKSLQKRVLTNAEILKNTRFSATIAQKSLLLWLKDPVLAPGKRNKKKNSSFGTPNIGAAMTYLKQRGLKAFLNKCRQYVSSKFG